MGKPGTGKGTQTSILYKKRGIYSISTGALIRNLPDNALGMRLREQISDGGLVSDEDILQLLGQELENTKYSNGCLLDGFPRRLSQAQKLESIATVGRAFLFDVPDNIALERILGRVSCKDCGEGYHLQFKQPEIRGACNHCDGVLIQRPEDSAEAFEKRIGIYNEETIPAIKFYEARGKIRRIDANKTPEEVAKDFLSYFP